jgi:type II secretory pathway component PulL
MILEPKHKNFKDEYKIKERVLKKFNIWRHMSVLVALE